MITCANFIDAGKVQDEAAAIVNKTRSQWNADTSKAKVEAKKVYDGLVVEVESLRKNLLNAVKTLGDQAIIDKVNKTLSERINKMKDQFSEANVAKFFDMIDSKVQEYFSNILKQIIGAESSAKLQACWDKNKESLKSAIEAFLKELRTLITSETKMVYNEVEKLRKNIAQVNQNVTAEVKKCQSVKDPKSCVKKYVRSHFRHYSIKLSYKIFSRISCNHFGRLSKKMPRRCSKD